MNTGKHNAKVNAADLGEASTGTPFVWLEYQTDEGKIEQRMYCSENAMPYTIDNLKNAFDFDGDFHNLDQLLGMECVIVVAEEEDDKGNTRLRVKFVNPPQRELDQTSKKSLAERLNAVARGGSAKKEDTTPF